jgi:hypothetical protein
MTVATVPVAIDNLGDHETSCMVCDLRIAKT